MIIKNRIENELYVYISNGKGGMDLLYKRWIKQGYGMVFCNIWGGYPFVPTKIKWIKDGE